MLTGVNAQGETDHSGRRVDEEEEAYGVNAQGETDHSGRRVDEEEDACGCECTRKNRPQWAEGG
jgi:hypothetical protein